MAQRKFHFRLEALLTHRTMVEKEKQRRVSQIQQEIQSFVRQLQEAQERIQLENRNLSAHELVGKLDMQFIAHGKRYVGNLHVKIILGMQKLSGMEQMLAGARAELLEAARSRKVIEKLKEKQLIRWRAEQDRKEAALLDEIGTHLSLRQQREIAERELAGASTELQEQGEP
jgi:flagellar FliJ protein